jgi:hypothetical protein
VIDIRAGQPDAVVRLQAGGDLRGEWDPDRLAQVVSNLVANAVQPCSGTPDTVTAQDDGGSVTPAVHKLLASTYNHPARTGYLLTRAAAPTAGRWLGLGRMQVHYAPSIPTTPSVLSTRSTITWSTPQGGAWDVGGSVAGARRGADPSQLFTRSEGRSL